MAGEEPRVVSDDTNHRAEHAQEHGAREPSRSSDPQGKPAPLSAGAFLAGGGEMSKRIRSLDWSETPLGPVEAWPQSLKTAVGIILGARSPMDICWGADLILLYNDSYRALIGNKHPDALGQPAREVFPEIWGTTGPMLNKVMTGQGATEGRNQLLPLDRGQGLEDAWFDYTFNPIRRADGSVGGVFAIATETTEKILAERAGREAADRLAFVLENSDDNLFLQNLDLRYVWLSKPAHPFVREDYIGHTDLEMDGPREQLERLAAIKRRVIETGQPVTMELSLNLKEERRHFHATYKPWRDDEGQVIGLVGYVRDITQRKRAEESLRESEARYRSLFENSVMGISQALPNGRLVAANNTYAHMYGYANPEEMMAQISDVGHQLYADPAERTEVLRILKERGVMEPRKISVRRRDGTEFFVLVGAREIRDSDGKLLCYQAEHVDITERVHSEQKRAEQAKQLRLLNVRLADIQEAERRRIARELHDQVGQNLTALGINLNVLRPSLDEASEEARTCLEDLLALVKETTGCIRSVIADLRPPELDDYGLLAALRWYAGQIGERMDLDVTVEGQAIRPRMPLRQETALFRIAQEALNNVVKHAQATHSTVTVESNAETVRMTIADNGMGFDSARLERADAASHWGLLSMRERAQAIGARWQIESIPEQGTRVVVAVKRPEATGTKGGEG